MRKTKNIIKLIVVILVIGIPSLHVKANYYSNQDGFDEIDKEHEWEIEPDSPARTITMPEVSYMYDSETDSYTDTLTYSEHSYCAKCGFDLSQAYFEGKDEFAEHEKTGCDWDGRVTGLYYITVDWPAQYVCKKCKAWKYFNADASQEGMFNQYCIQNKDYDKIIWHISKKCSPPSPSPSLTPTPSPSPTSNPTITPTSSPTVAPTSTPTSSVDAPSAPTLKSVKNLKGKKLSVKWKKVKEAKGYQVQYALNKSFTKSRKSDNTVKCTYAKKNLKKKKTYYVRVRAYVKDSNYKKVYGDWSKVKKIKIKK